MQESADPPAALVLEPAIDRDERMWAMFCHLAAIVGGFLPVLPMGNILGPLIVWLVKKEEFPFVDEQGKEVLNFEITMTIAAFVCIPLVFLLIGIPLLLAIVIFNLVMNIIGAVKTNEGVHFRYPYRIEFFK